MGWSLSTDDVSLGELKQRLNAKQVAQVDTAVERLRKRLLDKANVCVQMQIGGDDDDTTMPIWAHIVVDMAKVVVREDIDLLPPAASKARAQALIQAEIDALQAEIDELKKKLA